MNNIDIIKLGFKKGNNFHKKVYPLFKIFINFLNLNKIKYYLCGGTLLGCIRNNGRIGWDDDYDIFINTYEIDKFNKFNKINNNILTDKNVIYHFQINNNGYIINLHSSKFWQVWQLNENNVPVNKITDIFNEKDDWYKDITIPKGPTLKKNFHDMICSIPFNYEEQLSYFYENYMTDYVLCNHGINTCYKDEDRNKYIILTKKEYEFYSEKFGIF